MGTIVSLWRSGRMKRSWTRAQSTEQNYVFLSKVRRQVNRGVGLGVEVPYVYKFYGRQAHIKKLQEIVSKQ